MLDPPDRPVNTGMFVLMGTWRWSRPAHHHQHLGLIVTAHLGVGLISCPLWGFSTMEDRGSETEPLVAGPRARGSLVSNQD